MMDGDGQHPPELIPEMINLYRMGYDIVLTQRVDEPHRRTVKQTLSDLFYRVLNRISETRITPGSADFRLLSRKVVNALSEMDEYHRFIRGMIAWTGYPTVVLRFQPGERLGGKSKYSFKKMLGLALAAIFYFSLFPLQIGISLGVVFFLLAIVESAYVLSFWFLGKQDVLAPGWSSLMLVLLTIGGILMFLVGIIGIYVGYIFQQVKRRPLYLVDHVKRSPD
jgi:dolichol-phosphate mannosyltransferase